MHESAPASFYYLPSASLSSGLSGNRSATGLCCCSGCSQILQVQISSEDPERASHCDIQPPAGKSRDPGEIGKLMDSACIGHRKSCVQTEFSQNSSQVFLDPSSFPLDIRGMNEKFVAVRAERAQVIRCDCQFCKFLPSVGDDRKGTVLPPAAAEDTAFRGSIPPPICMPPGKALRA